MAAVYVAYLRVCIHDRTPNTVFQSEDAIAQLASFVMDQYRTDPSVSTIAQFLSAAEAWEAPEEVIVDGRAHASRASPVSDTSVVSESLPRSRIVRVLQPLLPCMPICPCVC